MGARFALGETYITSGAQEALDIAGETPIQFLRRHMSADWGEVSEDDAKENELSLTDGFRLLSAYRTAKGQKIWIITEADRRRHDDSVAVGILAVPTTQRECRIRAALTLSFSKSHRCCYDAF